MNNYQMQEIKNLHQCCKLLTLLLPHIASIIYSSETETGIGAGRGMGIEASEGTGRYAGTRGKKEQNESHLKMYVIFIQAPSQAI